MKESFTSLYTRLCSEYEKELEDRRKTRNRKAMISFSLLGVFLVILSIKFNSYAFYLALLLIPIFYIIFRLFVKNNDDKYSLYFKDNVIKALVQNVYDKAGYFPNIGIQPIQYNSSVYKERYDEYKSLDKVVVKNDNELEFSEVYTKKVIKDPNGHVERIPVFSGVARNV